MPPFRLPPPALALICWAAVAVPDASAQAAPKRPVLPKDFTAEYDVKYVPDGDSAQTLDIYFAEKAAAQPQPLLIWIHGGGWRGGSKTGVPYLNQLSRGCWLRCLPG
jgi:acetyl esterase/lipase